MTAALRAERAAFLTLETADRKVRCLVGRGAAYGDFGLADEALVGFRGPVARIVLGGSEDDGVFRGRGCEGRVWARRLEEERRPCEDIAFLLQRGPRNAVSPRLKPVEIATTVSSPC